MINENETLTIEDTISPPASGGVGLRDEDINKVLQDVESITGEPLRKRRGRKPKAEKQAEENVRPPLPFDAAQVEPILVSVYLQLLSIFARAPIVVTPEQHSGIGPLLTICANQYIPGDASKHLPAVALVLMTFEIIRQSRVSAAATQAQQTEGVTNE